MSRKSYELTGASSEAGAIFELWDWIKSLCIALLIVVVINSCLLTQALVRGTSMLPTLDDGNRVLVNRAAYMLSRPAGGDVIVLKDPDPRSARSDFLVKRIAAVGGEEIELRLGKLLVNGQQVTAHESQTPDYEDEDWGPYTVSEGYVFVIGDNRKRAASRDSRAFGAVPEQLIVGRACAVLWPLHQLKGM